MRLKVEDILEDIRSDTSFQFQTGAIKSNSILVRLKQTPASFNSKLVRLKGLTVQRLNFANPSFNSKLVRLKGDVIGAGSGGRRSSFNSKLVRLKAVREVRRDGHWVYCFNSKLVRLKGDDVGGFVGGGAGFQFQTGAIKSYGWENRA